MRLRNYVIGGLCSAVIAAQGASTPGGNDPAVGDDGLDVVPEDNLKDMRGGVDLGNLVGYFAIDRVVEVDGQVVAKMQIVVSNLDKLGTGQMPTVSVSGPLSELVQVMNGPAGSGGTEGVPAAVVAAAKSLAATQSNQSSVAGSGSASTTAGVNGSSGSAGGAASTASQAAAGTFTVNVGTGTTVIPTTGGASTVTSNASNASSAQGAAGSASAGTTSAGGGSGAQSTANAETINKIIPIGSSGQYVVVSNLPSSAGLATAIQNEVRGTMVQVQTTITAQLNSLTLLNSTALANALRSVSNLPTTTSGR
jgi:hypothetical protein